ncbi:MAG: peptide chain release factor 1 [bacterium]|nr:peptide chain release factor 1 [bacterium]
MEIEEFRKEYEKIMKELSDPELFSDWSKSEEISKRKVFLEKIINSYEKIEKINKEIKENQDLLKNEKDAELMALAAADLKNLEELKEREEKKLKKILSGEEDDEEINTTIIEIRAGTGGEEAALFAGDLFGMYNSYASKKNWRVEIIDSSKTDLKGFKEIIFQISGGNSFDDLKFEGGVHRVQRIPTTEKSGRIHTSTATVAVLPKPKKTEIKIRPDDLRIDTYRASGPGGQYVNKRESAIRITHIPTGLVVTSQNQRTQLANRGNALKLLEIRLYQKNIEEASSQIQEKRKEQIKTAERSEKIRTYNFPQDRITDHRATKSWRGIEGILSGDLGKITDFLKSELK